MSTILEKSTVTLAYTGKLDNGEVFTSVNAERPFTITIGNHELPPTLENSLIGLAVGDKRTIRLSPEEGYGARQKLLVQELSRSTLGDKIEPKPGMILSLKVDKDGEEVQVPATVMEVNKDIVVIDYNHPLAGHHLTYEVHILKIENS